MRTVKRHSRELNKGKWETIVAIAEAYAAEKDKWLAELSHTGQMEKIRSDRLQRDILVKQKYISPEGLQARQWKQALKDSVETLDKNWKGLFVELRPLILGNKNLTVEQRHYCLWVLSSYERLQGLVLRDYPIPAFSIAAPHIRKAGNYLNRIIRRHKGSVPRVKKARSFCVDANMYSIVENNETQIIIVVSNWWKRY